jgi:hypothetical protein
MPYMINDTISKSVVEGGIEISDAQYQSLLVAKMEGKPVTVRNGEPFIYSGDKRAVYRLVDNVVESQEILTEDPTPAGWQTIEPTPEPEPITQVSRAQGTAQLQLSGYWETVVTLVEAIPDPSTKIIAKQALYAANTWQKSSPTMQLLAGEDGLNLTQQQFDELFINANQIQL